MLLSTMYTLQQSFPMLHTQTQAHEGFLNIQITGGINCLMAVDHSVLCSDFQTTALASVLLLFRN